MKKILKTVSIIILTIFIFGGCKKQNDNEPSGTNNSAQYFIEFKIDGQLYRMEESYTNSSDFVIGTATHQGPFFDLYGLNIAFAHSTSDEGTGIIIQDSTKITQSHYTFTFPDNVSTFAYIMPNGNEFLTDAGTIGIVDFTAIDTVLGKPVEGTFSFTNLQLLDSVQNQISTGHTLTEGKFKTLVK